MRNKIRERLGTTATVKGLKVPSGSIWPNAEFGLGFYSEYEATSYAEEYGYMAPGPSEGEASPLTLSDVPNSHIGPSECLISAGAEGLKPEASKKKGLHGLTTLGGRMVRSGCYLMEQKLGKHDCNLWTFTVPTLPPEARRELARNWGKLVNRLLQQLSRLLAKSGRPPAIVGCTEIQTARLEKYREGYLHLHLVCPVFANVGGRFALDVAEVRSWWNDALERYSGHPMPRLPRVQAEVVRKSVEGYMGKYLSKGSGEELRGFIDDLGEDSVPGQWWFCTSLVRERVKSGVRAGKNAGAVLEAFIQWSFETGDMSGFEYISHVDVWVDGVAYTAGWYGRLRRDVADDLLAFLTP